MHHLFLPHSFIRDLGFFGILLFAFVLVSGFVLYSYLQLPITHTYLPIYLSTYLPGDVHVDVDVIFKIKASFAYPAYIHT